MPPPLTSPQTATRRMILRRFPPEYEAKWNEMRRLQRVRHDAIHGESNMGFGSLFFGILGLIFLVSTITKKDHDGIIIASGMIFFGIFFGICFLSGLKNGKRELPKLNQKIKLLKGTPEMKAILNALKEGGVEWTSEDDATII